MRCCGGSNVADDDGDSSDDDGVAHRAALHTETINIWSHLLPWLLMQYNTWAVFAGAPGCSSASRVLCAPGWRPVGFAYPQRRGPGGADTAVLWALTSVQQSVMLFSALAHAFHPVSRGVCRVVWSLDYAGIALAIGGSGAMLWTQSPLLQKPLEPWPRSAQSKMKRRSASVVMIGGVSCNMNSFSWSRSCSIQRGYRGVRDVSGYWECSKEE